MLKKTDSQTYTVYGLNIKSPIPLPDLIETTSAPDLEIILGQLTADFLAENLIDVKTFERPGYRIKASARAILLEWEKVGKVLVRDGLEVIVEPETEVEQDLQPFLTGPVLSVLLHQRGFLVLHASAIVTGGVAVAFLGAKGFGKSTLAAYMQVRGHRLISDDLVPVGFNKKRIMTFPGYPKVKLFPDSVEAVGENPAHLPLIHRWVEKHSFRCAENFSTAPVPLNAIYILSQGEKICLTQLDLKSAFIEMTRYSHLNRYLEATDNLREHFEQCQKLVENIPVFELQRPHDFSKMAEISVLLENHALEIREFGKLCLTA